MTADGANEIARRARGTPRIAGRLLRRVRDFASAADADAIDRKIADNAPLSNYVMIQALARIEDMDKAGGLFTESLCAALTQTSPHAVEGLQAFLQKRDPSFR